MIHKKAQRCLSFLLAVLIIGSMLSILAPVQTYAGFDNATTLNGMIIWGTSAVNRFYKDLSDEWYDQTGTVNGHMEVAESSAPYIWASDVETEDYLDYGQGRSDGLFPQYYTAYPGTNTPLPVADLGSAWPGQVSLSGNPNPQPGVYKNGYDTTYNGTTNSCWGIKNALKAAVNIKKWDLQDGEEGHYVLTSEPVFNADGTPELDADGNQVTKPVYVRKDTLNDDDTSASGSDSIAVVLMAGEDWVVYGNDSSVKTPQVGVKAIQYDWMGLDLECGNYSGFEHSFNPAPGTDIKKGDDAGAAIDGVNCAVDGDPGASVSSILSSASTVSGYHHDYVYENSHRVSDPVMDEFTYSSGDDNCDVAMEHKLQSLSDSWPSEDTNFGTTTGTIYARVLGGYEYTYEFLEHDTSITPPDVEYTEYTYYVPDYKSQTDTEQNLVLTGGAQMVNEGETAPAGTHVFNYNGNQYYSTEEAAAAHYAWKQVTVSVPNRCDADLAPNAGFADSKHTHTLGGSSGYTFEDGEWKKIELPYEGLAFDTMPEGATVDVETWYTDPEKPIMKADSESRDVTGYLDYWQNYQPGVQFYIIGIGPYNKAEYEDEKDSNWVTPGQSNEAEIEMTNQIEDARVKFNTAVKSVSGSVKFIDMTDAILKHGAYYRNRGTDMVEVVEDGSVNPGSTESGYVPWYNGSGGRQYDADASHGKWYARNTNQWLFHTIWKTVRNDNPAPAEYDTSESNSFFAASCALTAYASTLLQSGRQVGDEDSADYSHDMSDVLAGGMANSGSFVGYVNTRFHCPETFLMSNSSSSSHTSYQALKTLNNDSMNGAYLYSRYGKLLADMGLDKVDTEHTLSGRWISGGVLALLYTANTALSVVWDASMSLLKLLNPFQFFHAASSISTAAKTSMGAGSESPLVKLSQDNPGIAKMFQVIGKIYDTITGQTLITETTINPFTGEPTSGSAGSFSFAAFYLVLFIALSLLIANYNRDGSKLRMLLIRLTFIFIGVPMLGLIYTAALNGLSSQVATVAAPSSQMISATLVDFAGWVKASRLLPPAGVDNVDDSRLFVSLEGEGNSPPQASEYSINSIRSIAAKLNHDVTGRTSAVDMTAFVSAGSYNEGDRMQLDNYSAWNEAALYKVQPNSVEGAFAEWQKGLAASSECFSMLTDWMRGDFYYGSDFERDVMNMMRIYDRNYTNNHKEVAYTDEESGQPLYYSVLGLQPTESSVGDELDYESINKNSMYELLSSSADIDGWMERSVDDNKKIMTGDFGGAAMNDEENFNYGKVDIYGNGGIDVSTSGTDVAYQTGALVGDNWETITEGAADRTSLGLFVPFLQNDSSAGYGLSTLAMYNYLNTAFTNEGVTVYSSVDGLNAYTTAGHYRVNMVGSGATQLVVFLNCFAFLFVVTVIGFNYSLGMMFSVFKKSLMMVLSIPFALMGLMRSIVQVVTTVIVMIIEIFTSLLLYTVVSDLLLGLMSVLDNAVGGGLQYLTDHLATSLSGGILGFIARAMPESLRGSTPAWVVFMAGISLLTIWFAIKMWKAAPVFQRVAAKALDWYNVHFMTPEQRVEYWDRVNGRNKSRRQPRKLGLLYVNMKTCMQELLS